MVKHLRLPTIFTALVVATHSLAAETSGRGLNLRFAGDDEMD